MRKTLVPVVALTAAALVLGACSAEGAGSGSAGAQTTGAAAAETTEPSAGATGADAADPGSGPTAVEPDPSAEEPDDAPTGESEVPVDAGLSTQEQRNPEYPSSVGTDGPLYPTGARVARHDGYERVVIDFEGTGTPGWAVRYVDEPVADDSGTEVDLEGAYVLRIDASGLSTPASEDFDVEEIAFGSYDTSGADLVQDVYVSGIFEGWSGSLVGLDERAPFRVFTLTDPTRLVVDVSTVER